MATSKKLKQRRRMGPTAIDLFAGCGGLSLGLKQAGFDVLCAIEIDEQAEQTYRLNHPKVLSKRSDIKRIAAATLMRELKLKPGELDLLGWVPSVPRVLNPSYSKRLKAES
jgi:DNA (cytosine-5)-methyltransferase 1